MKPGDLVRLKSGGPVMNIGAHVPDGLLCFWYDKSSGDVKQATIRAAALDHVFTSETEDGMRTEYGDILEKVGSWPKNVRQQMVSFLQKYERMNP